MKTGLAIATIVSFVATLAFLLPPSTVMAQSSGSQVGTPSNLSAAPGSEPGTVDLSWTPGEGAQYHFIAYLPSNATDLNDMHMQPVSAEGSATIAGLDSGTEYYFVVIAGRWEWTPNFGAKWSAWSNWASATPTPPPTPGPFSNLLQDPSLPPYIDWKIQSEVDRSEVEAALLGIKLMYEFGKSLDMPDPEGRITVYIDNDVERLASYYSELVGWDLETSRKYWETSMAIAGRGSITVKASPPGEPIQNLDRLVGIMAHELVHTSFQNGVAGLLTDPTAFEEYRSVAVPRWLTEGMAVLLTELALAEHRGTDHSQVRKGRVSQVAAIDLLLQDAETWPSGWVGTNGPDDELVEGLARIDCIYECGYLAVELLASHVGLRKLADYYMYLEPRMVPGGVREEDFPRPGWREAFERAYGMTVEEFYQLFEEHRAAGFPEPELPK